MTGFFFCSTQFTLNVDGVSTVGSQGTPREDIGSQRRTCAHLEQTFDFPRECRVDQVKAHATKTDVHEGKATQWQRLT